jgi:hypothetical protein
VAPPRPAVHASALGGAKSYAGGTDVATDGLRPLVDDAGTAPASLRAILTSLHVHRQPACPAVRSAGGETKNNGAACVTPRRDQQPNEALCPAAPASTYRRAVPALRATARYLRRDGPRRPASDAGGTDHHEASWWQHDAPTVRLATPASPLHLPQLQIPHASDACRRSLPPHCAAC